MRKLPLLILGYTLNDCVTDHAHSVSLDVTLATTEPSSNLLFQATAYVIQPSCDN